MITVVDLGIGNIGSLLSALRFLGAEHIVATDQSTVGAAGVLVLPGVGSFSAAVTQLDKFSLRGPILEHAFSGRPLLGVCVGMQLLLESSDEGEGAGLGLINGCCERLGRIYGSKVPHVGFDSVHHPDASWLAASLGKTADYYFTHSYALRSSNSDRDAWCHYDGGFVAVLDRWPVVGAQFHPEKSQTSGLRFLRDFVARARGFS